MKKLIGLVLLLTLLGSCSDKGTETIRKPLAPEVSLLLTDLEQLESGLSDDLFMRNSTREEVENVKNYLMMSRILGLRLNEHPTDRMAATELFKTLKRIENFPFSARDAGLFEGVLQNLRITLNKFAEIQGLDLAGLEWTLLNFRFNGALTPFKAIKYTASSPIWKYGTFKADTFAKIDSRGVVANSWLFSPYFDLTDSKKHQLVINHIVRNPEWNNFKAMVSENYDGADPEKSDWVELKIKPSRNVQANQWTTLFTNPIDLSAFAGKKITIAFQFLADEKSNSVWEVLGLEIKGTGDAIKHEEFDVTYEPTPIETPEEGENNE